jgi:alkyl hydroperoxide reductase subunit AhpF
MHDRPVGSAGSSPFDQETQQLLQEYLQNLPKPVYLHMWGDPRASTGEREAARLIRSLSETIEPLHMAIFPRRENYPYYPVLGVLAENVHGMAPVDYGVRFIGLPAGVQITSLIAAIQAVAFQGATLEARTRIQLSKLEDTIQLELLSAAEDELGAIVAKSIFGMAVASPHIRSYLIMADVFPEALWKYSVRQVPHLVVNGRVHLQGHLSENEIVRGIARAVSPSSA